MSVVRDKYPHVSYYPVKSRQGGGAAIERWRVTYRLPGRAKRTERLGVAVGKAQKRARQISELIDSIKSKLISVEEVERQLEDARGITQHIDVYEQFLISKGNKDQYITRTIQRIRTSVLVIGATRIGHLTPRSIERLIETLRTTRKPRGDGKPGGPTSPFLSTQTIQHYVKAVKQFTRRMKKAGRITQDLLADVDGVKVTHSAVRREVTEEEIRILLPSVTVAVRKKWNEMLGPDRAMLYTFAFVTGLRAGELRPATADWLDLSGTAPALNVPAAYTKNKKPAKQPLTAWLVEAATKWLSGRKGKLFPLMPQSLHRMFQKDREAARAGWIKDAGDDAERDRREKSDVLKYSTSAGVLVFHSLRHGYVSMLANTDVPAKLVQALARHADIGTTMNRYAHAQGDLASAAVERVMPNLLAKKASVKVTKRVVSAEKTVRLVRKREAQRSSVVVRRKLTAKDGKVRDVKPERKGQKTA